MPHNLKKAYLLFLDIFDKPDINFALFLRLEEREERVGACVSFYYKRKKSRFNWTGGISKGTEKY